MIAAIDRKMSEAGSTPILHHAELPEARVGMAGIALHGSANTETDEFLKIRVMGRFQAGPRQDPQALQGPRPGDQSPLFKKASYEEEYGPVRRREAVRRDSVRRLPLRPLRRPNVELLGEMSKIRRCAPLPVHHRCSAERDADGVLGRRLANPRDLTKIFLTPEVRRLALAARKR